LLTPEDLLREWQDRIRAAHAARQPLHLRGGGSKDFYGQTTSGELFDTRPYAGIIDYEPTELVITARCGTPLAQIEQTMHEAGQMLAFEPPHFGPGATLGGCLAAGLSGPRRPYAGAVRDLVLGVKLIDGRGTLMRFGGQVMKNVAGFDVSRLMAGALGTLGLIAEVSLKAAPLPAAETTLRFELSAHAAMDQLNRWASQPLPISATCHHEGWLSLRLSGAAAAVRAARAKLGGEVVEDAESFWRMIRDHTHPFFAGEEALWRLSVKPSAPYTDLAAPQLIEWGGGQRWLRTGDNGEAPILREWARAQGGHATLFRRGLKSAGVFQPLPAALAALHRRIKLAFDPAGIFNPGRLYPDL
jgi:glycolate oxidase FAD binding subunit